MRLEDQVASLELSRKLKALGVKQESVFVWYGNEDKGTSYVGLASSYSSRGICAAFTVAELGEILPLFIVSGKTDRQPEFKKYLCFEGAREGRLSMPDKRFIADDGTEANARAKMLIYLIENKIINPTPLEDSK